MSRLTSGWGKHPTMQKKLRRDIRRQWPQFTALVVTVMLGIAMYAVSDNAYQNLQASYDNVFEQQGFPDLFVTGGDIDEFTAEAGKTEGVSAVSTRIQADIPMEVQDSKLTGRIISYPSTGHPDVSSLTTLTGADNPSGSKVLLEQHFAEDFGMTEGDQFQITGASGTKTVTVAGTVASGEYLWPAPSRQQVFAMPKTFGVAYTTPELAAELAGFSEPNQSLVLLTDQSRDDGSQPLPGLEDKALDLGATEVLTRDEQPSNSVLELDISGFEQMAVLFPVLFLSAAGLAMYVLLTRRVQQERPIIGMFRAEGMRSRTIAAHYLRFGLYASVLGALIGLPLGILGAGELSRIYVAEIRLPESLMIIEPFRAETVLIGLLFAVVAGALASWAPAVLASKVTPADAMRGETPPATGHVSLIERIIPPLQRAPARWRLIIRSISRHKKRAVFTATGVAMALLLTLVSGLMLSTMNDMIDNQFVQVQKNDAQVLYSQPVGSEQLGKLSDIGKVTTAESVVEVPVSVRQDGDTYATSLTGFDAHTQMHGFHTTDGELVQLPDDGVLISNSITAQLPDLEAGDQIKLTVSSPDPTRPNRTEQVTVVNLVDESLGTFVYSTKEFLTREFGAIPAMSAMLRTAPDTDQDALQAEVQKQPGVVAYTQTQILKTLWDDYAGLFYIFIGAMLVLGGLMAFAIIFTTMSVNIVERERELATLRAAGVRQRTLAALVGGENLIIAGFGVIPGILLGIVGAQVMLSSYSNDQFTMNLVLDPWTLLASAAAIMVVALISQWPGLRAIRRMNIAQVVRERSS